MAAMDIFEKLDTLAVFSECCLTKGGKCMNCPFYTAPMHGQCGKCMGYKKIGPLLTGWLKDIRKELENGKER